MIVNSDKKKVLIIKMEADLKYIQLVKIRGLDEWRKKEKGRVKMSGTIMMSWILMGNKWERSSFGREESQFGTRYDKIEALLGV